MAEAKLSKKKPSIQKNLAKKNKTKSRRPANVKNKSSSKIKTQLALSKNTGWKVPYIKKRSFLGKMKLRKGDIIHSISGQAVHSKKQVYQVLSSLSKKQKKVSLFVTRNKKDFLISYKVESFKKKKRFIVSSIKLVKNKTASNKKQKKTKKSSLKNKKPVVQKTKKAKQNIVPEKYKAHLQRAYVGSLNSFVYQHPNFDSQALYPLPVGQKILISKKIFRPSHNFGSFYKVFLFREKKIVGYISEAEVIPEFLKKNGKYTSNKTYKSAKKQIAKDKVLDLDLIEKSKKQNKQNQQAQQQATPESKSKTKRYVGLSFGALSSNLFSLRPNNLYAGLKLSGYDLLISYLNMDLNLMADVYSFKFFYFDILAAYPIAQAPPFFHLFALGGLNMSVNKEKDLKDPVDYGFSGALSAITPIKKNILFRIDAKAIYSLRNQPFRYGLLGSLQIAF